jgi:2-methylcitrate dehydratase
MVELARQNKFDPGKVVSIEADVTRITYDFAGGGLYGVDKLVRTKELADHNLPYLLAVALLKPSLSKGPASCPCDNAYTIV